MKHCYKKPNIFYNVHVHCKCTSTCIQFMYCYIHCTCTLSNFDCFVCIYEYIGSCPSHSWLRVPPSV